MFLFHTLHIALFLFFGLPLVYLALLTAGALRVRLHRGLPDSGAPALRFAFVVPAHNEESSLQKTIRSLKSLDYPSERFEVIVVADNCTDRTANIAEAEGARVLERVNAELRGKGYALRWAFDLLLREPGPGRCDAIVVIDADTVVSGNYLSMLTVAIKGGAQVMQTSDLVEPRPDSWTTEALRLSFVLYNYVRPLGRKAFGFSAGLRGNGMCFTREALERVPWHAFSKAEDLEYGLQMLLAGYPTVFVPEAIALATMPQKASNAESQRARWEGGRLPVIRRYAGMLLSMAFRRRSLAAFDAFIDLATPAFVNMMALSLLFFLVSSVWWMIAPGTAAAVFACAWGGALLSGALHVAGGLKVSGDPSLRRTLAAIPRYVAWKVLLYFKLARAERSEEWVRTTRETEGTEARTAATSETRSL